MKDNPIPRPDDIIGPVLVAPIKRAVLPWLVVAGLLLLLAAAGVGFWAGNRWSDGSHAIDQAKALEDANAQLLKSAEAVRKSGVDAVASIHSAAARQGEIAKETIDVLEENREADRRQAAQLEQLLHDRPDLGAVRVGPDLLCAWNRARQGRGAGPAAATPGCGGEPARALPGAAPGDGRQPAQPPAKQPGNRTDAPRVHRSSVGAGQGHAGAAGHRLGLVLPRDPRTWRVRRWLWT